MTMTKQGYMPRIIDQFIREKLETFDAVCIEGPKWCGKTWTALNHAQSVVFIGDPANNFQNRTMAQLDPNLILNGETPKLIDEWQEVPPIWDAVRFRVDQNRIKGQFILTGSSTPQTKGIHHSGTGRIDRIRMRPMSLFESDDSSGAISLRDIFKENITAKETEEITLERLIYLTVRGGWPGSLKVPVKHAADIPKSYLKSVIEDDLTRLDGIARDINKVEYLLKSLARNISTIVSNQTLKKDIEEFEDETIASDTISNYLDVLNRLFLIENQPAFDANYRSPMRVAKMPKRHFVDPSLAVAALNVSQEMLQNDLRLFGFLFESMAIRDLRIYAEANGGKVFHYRHHDTGNEIDAVVEMPDGSFGAFEIKLGVNQIDSAAKNLLAAKAEISKNTGTGGPDILCIICGLSNFAYRREDGIFVVPLTALRD